MKEKKICPFNTQPCMEKKCVLFDEEIWQCEFKNMTQFIGECFTELTDRIGEVGEVDDN